MVPSSKLPRRRFIFVPRERRFKSFLRLEEDVSICSIKEIRVSQDTSKIINVNAHSSFVSVKCGSAYMRQAALVCWLFRRLGLARVFREENFFREDTHKIFAFFYHTTKIWRLQFRFVDYIRLIHSTCSMWVLLLVELSFTKRYWKDKNVAHIFQACRYI